MTWLLGIAYALNVFTTLVLLVLIATVSERIATVERILNQRISNLEGFDSWLERNKRL